MQRPGVEAAVSQSDLGTNDLFCSAASSIRDVQISEKSKTPSSIDSGDLEKSITTVENGLVTEDPDKFQVTFDEADPENPLNWSFKKKFVIVSVAILLIFNS